MCRHNDEEDDLEESMSAKLFEQEDEDLNRIEESRRRRQAILEKYRSQQPQQENVKCTENADKGTLHICHCFLLS